MPSSARWPTADEVEADLSLDQRIQARIVQHRPEGLDTLLDQAIEQRVAHAAGTDQDLSLARAEAALAVLNQVLLPAMKDVGDRFSAGELILPFVLESAEVMKRSLRHLEQYLAAQQSSYSKGSVIVATLYGDVHDIGKSLLTTILDNNGYSVHDLGKQVPINAIVEAALELNPDAIGLSALLVS
ncbi:MAG TPA: B12-binding domain-containing protein, partial [Chloroflexota bacterium]